MLEEFSVSASSDAALQLPRFPPFPFPPPRLPSFHTLALASPVCEKPVILSHSTSSHISLHSMLYHIPCFRTAPSGAFRRIFLKGVRLRLFGTAYIYASIQLSSPSFLPILSHVLSQYFSQLHTYHNAFDHVRVAVHLLLMPWFHISDDWEECQSMQQVPNDQPLRLLSEARDSTNLQHAKPEGQNHEIEVCIISNSVEPRISFLLQCAYARAALQ
jgi:hypothetical protein